MTDPRPTTRLIKPRFCNLALLCCLVFSAPAGARIKVPEPRGSVTDLAGVVRPESERRIAAVIETLRQRTGAEIAVLTVDTTGGEPVFDYAMAVAEQWKPGQQEKDNGVVFVVAVKDRDMYILTGYGLEGVLPDGRVGGIEDRYIIPYFKKNDYGRGIFSGVLALATVIDPDNAAAYKSGSGGYVIHEPQMQPKRPSLMNYIVTIMMAVFFVYMAIRHPRLLLLFLLMSGGPRRSGGGFGGGFGGFGGGGFGGGGAGRSW